MDNDAERAKVDALSFLKEHKTGVLATVSPQGEPHASMVNYSAADGFNVYFLTLANSRKFEALTAHPKVAFTVAAVNVPRTLQIEGVAMDISLDEEGRKKKDAIIEVLNSNPWFPAPITKLDPADSVVVWIKPTWVRWADYAFAGEGNDKVFKEVPLS